MASRKLRKSSTKLSVSSPSLGASTPPLPRQSNHYQVEVALQARCDPLERAGINPEAVEEHHRFSLATPIQLVQSQASGLHEPATGKGGIPTVPWTARNFDHGMCGSRSRAGPHPVFPQDPPHSRTRDMVPHLRQLSDNPRITQRSFSVAIRTTNSQISRATAG